MLLFVTHDVTIVPKDLGAESTRIVTFVDLLVPCERAPLCKTLLASWVATAVRPLPGMGALVNV